MERLVTLKVASLFCIKNYFEIYIVDLNMKKRLSIIGIKNIIKESIN